MTATIDLIRKGVRAWNDAVTSEPSALAEMEFFDFSGTDLRNVNFDQTLISGKEVSFDGCQFNCSELRIDAPIINIRNARFFSPVKIFLPGASQHLNICGTTFTDVELRELFPGDGLPRIICRQAQFVGSFSVASLRLRQVEFLGTRFRGVANFQNTTFRNSTSFVGVRFDRSPNFHNAELHQDIEFNRASHLEDHFADTTSIEAERTFRTLKLQMNKAQAVSEEFAFARLELKAKAFREPWNTRWLYWLYGETSDYGQSKLRPVEAFALLTIAAWLLAFFQAAPDMSVFDSRLVAFVFSNSLPFVGGLKAFAPERATDVFQPTHFLVVEIVAIIQSIGSAVCIFLFGLAVRNTLRIR